MTPASSGLEWGQVNAGRVDGGRIEDGERTGGTIGPHRIKPLGRPYLFSSNECLGGFAGSELSLSIACCAGPDPTTQSRNSSAMAEFYPNV